MTQFEGDYQDQMVVCKECSQEFVFTAGEQAFFAEKGFAAPPKRCKSCRDRKKAMGDLGGGGGASYGGGGGGGMDRAPRRSSGPIEVHEKPARTFRSRDSGGASSGAGSSGGYRSGPDPGRAKVEVKCSECGVMTTVPFEPAPGRPVYCRNCYQNRRGV